MNPWKRSKFFPSREGDMRESHKSVVGFWRERERQGKAACQELRGSCHCQMNICQPVVASVFGSVSHKIGGSYNIPKYTAWWTLPSRIREERLKKFSVCVIAITVMESQGTGTSSTLIAIPIQQEMMFNHFTDNKEEREHPSAQETKRMRVFLLRDKFPH